MMLIYSANTLNMTSFYQARRSCRQNNAKLQINSAIIYENKLPIISFKGTTMPPQNNQEKNKIWTQKFDEAFETNDGNTFLKFVNERTRLKPLFSPTLISYTSKIEISNDPENKKFPTKEIILGTRTKPGNTIITADKTGHIQIDHSRLGHLFVDIAELENTTNMNPTDKSIIAKGLRGFDPFDQEDWPKAIGRKWPTAENTRDSNGVAKLSLDKSKKAVLLDTYPEITSSYGTKPRAMAVLDGKNDSVIVAFQQENQNPDIEFAAWSILPFKIKEGKKTVAIFPADPKSVQAFKDEQNDIFREIRQSTQWNINNKFFTVNLSEPSKKTEYIDPYADWCVFATQDDDTICLLRSCYKDDSGNKQFKVFSGGKELGGTKYAEVEFIAPKVPKGQKSTLVYRMDFIPIKKLGIKSLTAENMDEEMKKIGEKIENKITQTISPENEESSFLPSWLPSWPF